MKKIIALFSLTIVLILSVAGAVHQAAAADNRTGKTIVSIEVSNNKALSKETVLSKIKSQPLGQFSQEQLSEDLKRLYATDYFTDVTIGVEDVPDGVKVVITVEEKPIIDEVIFDGNKVISAARLRSAIKSKVGDVLSYSLLAQDITTIKRLYEKKGYHLAQLRHHLDIDKETNKAKIYILITEKTRVKISKITIEGALEIRENRIRKLLATKPAWFFNKGAFEDDVFAEDLEKTKSYYHDLGFLDVEIVPMLEYSDDGNTLNIVISITEGKQYRVGDVRITGNTAFPEDDIRKALEMRSDSVFSNRGLRRDIHNTEWFYYRHGYMNAQVEAARNLNPLTGNIDVTYTIESNEIVYVRKVEVQGNLKTKDIVIRRELRIYPGDKFDGDKIRRSKERLYNLGFFEDVSFDNVPTGVPNKHDLIVTVKETKTGEFSFGAGYSSIDEFIGFVEVRQRNFDITNFPSFMGAGQDLTIKTELGTVRRDYLLSWTEPWMFGYPYSFGFDIYQNTHSKRRGYIFEEVRTGGDLRLGREFTDTFRGDLMYRLEHVDISDVDSEASQDLKLEEGENWISSVLFQLTYDTRNNKFDPSRGIFLSSSIEPVGGILGGDKDFYKSMLTGKYYLSPVSWVVVEFKARAGIADSYGDSPEVPVYERFYAGGANTIRGYDERRVSPRDPGNNAPVGGEALLVGNVEAVVPIFQDILKGAVFFDSGNVWRRLEDFGDGNLRSGTGVGVRIKTPIGPVKLDYGWPLSENYGDKKEAQFYFSISHGF
ncbi:MAG: outer membrane protein assembly factor BamA [Candidatus Omnitrophota bacterium]